MEISGTTTLLTGATGGLGRAIAQALAERGSTLVLSSRKPEELDELAASLPGEDHRSIVSDLADPGAAEELVAEAGNVDILVANAGLPGTGRVEELEPRWIERALRVNLEAPILQARLLIPGMRERGSGQLVFISSLAGRTASPRSGIYNATKFGLRGFSHALRSDLAADGIGVSVVLPGFIRDAGMFADAGSKAPPGVGTSTPDEVGKGVVRAITRDRAEVTVAPVQQRLLASFGGNFPGIAARIQQGGAGTRTAEQLARGQAKKR